MSGIKEWSAVNYSIWVTAHTCAFKEEVPDWEQYGKLSEDY